MPSAIVFRPCDITADEPPALTTAVSGSAAGQHDGTQAENAERVVSKLRLLLEKLVMARIDLELEALTEAEGLVTRPGHKLKSNADVVGSYGRSLHGNRHYLICLVCRRLAILLQHAPFALRFLIMCIDCIMDYGEDV